MLWRGGAGPARRAGRLCVLAAPRWERAAAAAAGGAAGRGLCSGRGSAGGSGLCDERGCAEGGMRGLPPLPRREGSGCNRASKPAAVTEVGAGGRRRAGLRGVALSGVVLLARGGSAPCCAPARPPRRRVLTDGAGLCPPIPERCVSRCGRSETFPGRLIVVVLRAAREQSARRSLLVSLFFVASRLCASVVWDTDAFRAYLPPRVPVFVDKTCRFGTIGRLWARSVADTCGCAEKQNYFLPPCDPQLSSWPCERGCVLLVGEGGVEQKGDENSAVCFGLCV